MNVHTDTRMSREEFLTWVERQEGRYEFENGRVVMMVRVKRAHAVIAMNLSFILRGRLDPERFNVAAAEFAVNVGGSIRFPDVLVEPVNADGAGLAAVDPILIAEVLSPSTAHFDFGIKADEYRGLPSLQTYLILDQDTPRIWLWHRSPDGNFRADPEIIEDREAVFDIPALGLSIPLAEIYRRVTR